jgi:hypothetical protein
MVLLLLFHQHLLWKVMQCASDAASCWVRRIAELEPIFGGAWRLAVRPISRSTAPIVLLLEQMLRMPGSETAVLLLLLLLLRLLCTTAQSNHLESSRALPTPACLSCAPPRRQL